MNNVIVNEKFVLQLKDIGSALISAVVVPFLFTVLQWANSNGASEIDWKLIGFAALSAAITVIIKRLVKPASVTTTYSSNEAAKVVASKIQYEVIPSENMGGLYEVYDDKGKFVFSGTKADCDKYVASL